MLLYHEKQMSKNDPKKDMKVKQEDSILSQISSYYQQEYRQQNSPIYANQIIWYNNPCEILYTLFIKGKRNTIQTSLSLPISGAIKLLFFFFKREITGEVERKR